MSCNGNESGDQLDRRAWCCKMALSALSIGAVVCPSSIAADEGRGAVNISMIPVGGARLIPSLSVILVRSENGLAALSARCTHQNRKLNVDSRGRIVCTGHDSTFTHEGQPVSGPATRALPWYAVAVAEDGNIQVDSGRRVAAGSWAPLPAWAVAKRP